MAVMVLDRSDERIRRIARIYTVEEVDSITSSSSSEKTAQASLAVVNSSTSVVAQDYYDMGFLISEALDSFLFQNSDGLLKSIGVTGQTIVNVVRVRRGSVIGDSTTQFDVSNPAGNTYRYTYDGTGTDPGISDSDSSFRIGDEVTIIATNMASGNEGKFTLTGVGNNYFEVNISIEEVNLDEAKKMGAVGVFEAKYGDKVRVYMVGPSTSSGQAGSGQVFSREICGGPHAKRTGELGHFKIKKEQSSGAGVRRIKAVLK